MKWGAVVRILFHSADTGPLFFFYVIKFYWLQLSDVSNLPLVGRERTIKLNREIRDKLGITNLTNFVYEPDFSYYTLHLVTW